jgi:hypothetical protein
MRKTLCILAAAVSFAACRNSTPEKAVAPVPAPPSLPSQAPRLMSGVGNHHHSIATSSPEAQQYFDQGFDLVFGFNHEEAVRSFKRASELDPRAAMPHWGIAWALGPNYNLDVDDGRAREANVAIAQARVFRDDLARHPRNARSLFGLHESLLKQGRKADAAWVKRAFDEAWKDADSTLAIEAL